MIELALITRERALCYPKVGYTITRAYEGRFGITRHQDIKVSGSEF